ncbi:hypothetical protein HW49_10285 [Porphyromonadaceae bacterium COT-184 OH4590]|nr:hypothetical protein HW49_10285 [Porphyromonadaceae bacterium COT-184 OH4590]
MFVTGRRAPKRQADEKTETFLEIPRYLFENFSLSFGEILAGKKNPVEQQKKIPRRRKKILRREDGRDEKRFARIIKRYWILGIGY